MSGELKDYPVGISPYGEDADCSLTEHKRIEYIREDTCLFVLRDSYGELRSLRNSFQK